MPVASVAPGAPPPAAGAGAAGNLDPSKVKFAGPAKPAGGGGGGRPGAAPGPKEMLQGRQVTIEGKLSPETKAAQEAVIRRDAALKKREAVRGDERAEYDRENEDRAATIGAAHDLRIKETREAGQKALDDLAMRRADKLKEIEDGKVDPKKFWADRGTAHSIAAAIAVGLGAVGNAIAGSNGPNAALGIIDKAIDRDLDAQEKNLDKKKWEAGQLGALYAAEKEHLGDSIAARNEAKIAALTQFSAQAKRLAAMQNLEDRALKADRLALEADARIADLKAKNEDRIKEVQTYKTVMPGGGGGAPKKKSTGGVTIRLSDGKGGYQDKYFAFPPGMSEGQRADFMKRAQGVNNAHRSLDRIDAVRGAGIPIDDADARAFAQSYTYEYAEGKGQGQATADQEKSVAEKVSGIRGHKAIDAYRRNLDDTKEEMIRQLTPPDEGELWRALLLLSKRCMTALAKRLRSRRIKLQTHIDPGNLASVRGPPSICGAGAIPWPCRGMRLRPCSPRMRAAFTMAGRRPDSKIRNSPGNTAASGARPKRSRPARGERSSPSGPRMCCSRSWVARIPGRI